MKWHPPLPKTSDLFGLSRQDLYKRESSKERYLNRENAENIEKMEFWVGQVWLQMDNNR